MSDTKKFVGIPHLLALPLVFVPVGLLVLVVSAREYERGDERVTVRTRGGSYTTTAAAQGKFFMGLGGVFLLGGVLGVGWWYFDRRWLQVGPDGFTVTDYRGTRTFRDSDVTEFKRWERRSGCVVRLRVVRGGRSERLTLRFDSPGGYPFPGFFERLASQTKRSGTRRAGRAGPQREG
jgi:hypothetical protein